MLDRADDEPRRHESALEQIGQMIQHTRAILRLVDRA
jgi:hypothetical protein